MFKLIVQTSLRNRLFVLAAAAALVAYGLFVLPRISLDVFPDINRQSTFWPKRKASPRRRLNSSSRFPSKRR